MMGRLPWFRLWHEARNDAKLRTLADDEHRVWFNLLCLAADQDERGTIPAGDLFTLAIEVAHGDEALLLRTMERLVKLQILDDTDPQRLVFTNFVKRNTDKPSDAPAATSDRKRRQRERERELIAALVTDETETPAANDVTPDVTPPPSVTSPVRHMTSRDVTRRHAQEEIRKEERRGDQRESDRQHPPADEAPPGVAAPAPPDRPLPPGPPAMSEARGAKAEAVRLFHERFWPHWPRKIAKHEALAAFVKLGPSAAEVERMVAAIPIHYAALDWPRENWHFCPHAATWLNQRRWEDELTLPAAQPRAVPSARGRPDERLNGADAAAEAIRLMREEVARREGTRAGAIEAAYSVRR